jgi:hypothetical protein
VLLSLAPLEEVNALLTQTTVTLLPTLQHLSALFALKVLAPLEANATLLQVHACPQLVPFLQPLFAQTIKYVRQLLTELNHVLPSIAPLQLNALQTTAPKPQLRFVLCALKVNALLMKNVIPLKAHQQWEFVNQLLLASPTLAL